MDSCARAVVEEVLLLYHQKLNNNSFERHGERMFLERDEEIEMIKSLNKNLNQRVPDVRAHRRIKEKIRTIIKEDPIKQAQYIRGKSRARTVVTDVAGYQQL